MGGLRDETRTEANPDKRFDIVAKRGPKTQPTKKRKLLGNPSKRKMPENEVEPTLPPGVPPAPRDLTGYAKKEWERLAPELCTLGLLTNVDMTAFLAYCVCFGQWLTALAQTKRYGATKKTKSGWRQQSVYYTIANKSMQEMRKWLIEFGMTPSSRAGLVVDKPKPKSQADKFRDRKKKNG